MSDDRRQADRILVAQLTGEARHHARWRELEADEEAAAVAALRELAGGRADLLAEVAGVLEGTSEGELGRSVKEVLTIADDLHARGVGVKILTGKLSGSYSPHGEGKFFFTMMAAFAELERDIIYERTMAAA
jgi:hypothetical protein